MPDANHTMQERQVVFDIGQHEGEIGDGVELGLALGSNGDYMLFSTGNKIEWHFEQGGVKSPVGVVSERQIMFDLTEVS